MPAPRQRGYLTRAEIPKAIAGRTSTGRDEEICIERGFDRPWGAILVPMVESNGRFRVKGSSEPGQPLKAEYFPTKVRLISDLPASDGLFNLPSLEWPEDAERALLLVFYQGSFDSGVL